jgi:hypothetical protein
MQWGGVRQARVGQGQYGVQRPQRVEQMWMGCWSLGSKQQDDLADAEKESV